MTLEVRARVQQGAFVLDVDLRVTAGEVAVVVGPNGSGKTTLLRALAGLVPLADGFVRLAGRSLTHVSVQERRVALVFQDYRLFPHLTVLQNVAFPLRSRGLRVSEAHVQARRWIARVGLDELAARRPSQLSGGEAQRAALARALCSDPRLLLLDEPLAALDAQTRNSLRGELHRYLADVAVPVLLVTHDPLEALTLADRVVVLERGRIAQDAPVSEILSRPATRYVAELLGMNLVEGLATRGAIAVSRSCTVTTATVQLTGPALALVRPESLELHTVEPEVSGTQNTFVGLVTAMAPLGDRIRVSVACDPPLHADVAARTINQLRIVPGQRVWLTVEAKDVDGYSDAAPSWCERSSSTS